MANNDEPLLPLVGGSPAPEAPPAEFPVVPTPVSGLAPAQTISTPEHVDWHMIQDHELSQLSNLQSGIIASLGFTGLGAAIGLVGPFLTALSKVRSPTPTALRPDEVFYLTGFSATVVLGLICLVIHAINSWRRTGLAATIRARRKLGITRST